MGSDRYTELVGSVGVKPYFAILLTLFFDPLFLQGPTRRKRLQYPPQRHPWPLLSVQNRFNNFGREQRQP